MKKEEYLSEEELLNLIEETENGSMLIAPSYFKQEILDKIEAAEGREAAEGHEIANKEVHKKSRKQTEKGDINKIMFLYSLKVGAAAAAAILLMFLLPNVEDVRLPEKQDKDVLGAITTQMNEKTNQFCSFLNAASNYMISGGINNEE